MWIYVLVIRNILLFLLQIASVCIRKCETFPLATFFFIYRVYQEKSAMLRENVP